MFCQPCDLAAEDGTVAGALPSKAGAEHLRVLAQSAQVVGLQNLTELRGRPREFVRALAGAREAVGPRPLLYAASVADPASLALLVYLGADLLDDFEGVLAASAGVFLYNFGAVHAGLVGACHCQSCHEYLGQDSPESVVFGPAEPHAAPSQDSEDGGEDLGGGRGSGARRDLSAVPPESPLYQAALGHNRRAIAAEARIAARAVEEGTLRELVETRVRAQPWLVAALRNLDREFYPLMESLTPIWKTRLHALSHESLNRPEVRRWVERFKERYRPPACVRVLLLAPCSARKPYSLSKTHRAIDRALAGVQPGLAVHRVVVTSPLGLVPEELERVFPAAHYDIPVTGQWIREEEQRVEEQLGLLLSAHPYAAVVSLVGDDLPGLQGAAAGLVECAAKGRAWDDALKAAAEGLRTGLEGARRVDPRLRTTEDIASIARFQFGGAGAAALMEGAQVRGRYPWVRVMAGTTQLAMHVPDRGRLSLTLDGARRVASAGAYRVFIGDFQLRGDLFAVGVKGADPEIRAGDSVAVVQGDEVVAAGFARLSASEMQAMGRGIAVDIRHTAGQPQEVATS
jgi:archaeosine synthase